MKIFVKEYFNSPVGDMRLLLILLYLIHLLYNSILNYYKELFRGKYVKKYVLHIRMKLQPLIIILFCKHTCDVNFLKSFSNELRYKQNVTRS